MNKLKDKTSRKLLSNIFTLAGVISLLAVALFIAIKLLACDKSISSSCTTSSVFQLIPDILFFTTIFGLTSIICLVIGAVLRKKSK